MSAMVLILLFLLISTEYNIPTCAVMYDKEYPANDDYDEKAHKDWIVAVASSLFFFRVHRPRTVAGEGKYRSPYG